MYFFWCPLWGCNWVTQIATSRASQRATHCLPSHPHGQAHFRLLSTSSKHGRLHLIASQNPQGLMATERGRLLGCSGPRNMTCVVFLFRGEGVRGGEGEGVRVSPTPGSRARRRSTRCFKSTRPGTQNWSEAKAAGGANCFFWLIRWPKSQAGNHATYVCWISCILRLLSVLLAGIYLPGGASN